MYKDVFFQIMLYCHDDTIKNLKLVNIDGLKVTNDRYFWKLKFELEKIPSTTYNINLYDQYQQINKQIDNLLISTKDDGILIFLNKR